MLDTALRPGSDPEDAKLRLARVERSDGALGGNLPVVADWSNWGESESDYLDYAESQALCRAVLDREPPTADRPGEDVRGRLHGCNSEALLFGLGTRPDATAARHCAFTEAETISDQAPAAPFHGRSMLMHLYANGIGVKRDLDVAMHLACGLNAAPAETDARVLHLAELRDGGSGDRFDFCDDVTSGYTGAQCAQHEARIAAAERGRELDALSRDWSTAARQELAELARLHDDYAEKHGAFEQDPSGTISAEQAVRGSEELSGQFLDTVRRLAENDQPRYDRRGAEAADTRLNALYRKLMEPDRLEDRTMEAKEVRETQRAWLRYRDAFVVFAARQFPAVSRESIQGWLTEQRSAVLAYALHGCTVPSQCPGYPGRVLPHEQIVSFSLKESQR